MLFILCLPVYPVERLADDVQSLSGGFPVREKLFLEPFNRHIHKILYVDLVFQLDPTDFFVHLLVEAECDKLVTFNSVFRNLL